MTPQRAVHCQSNINAQNGFTFLELVAVSVVIAVLFVAGLKYYSDIANDAREAGLGMLANRFAAAASGIHLKWSLDNKPKRVELDGYKIDVNHYGWPMGATGLDLVEPNICRQLWQALLQNPATISDPDSKVASVSYRVAEPTEGRCRYVLISDGSKEFYFDYFLLNGKVVTGR